MEDLETLSRDELIQIILDQQRMLEQLREEIEQLKRRGGAAPFSKGERKADPKAPGRKRGQGWFRFRAAPEEAGQAEPVRVSMNAAHCPDCGGELGEVREEVVSTTDLPAQPVPEVWRYRVEVRHCQRCGKSLRGRHPDIAPDQFGATAHRVGSRVKAMAHILHYCHGVPVRKVPAIFGELTGVWLTQGAVTQDAVRRTEGAVGVRYRQLPESVKEQPVIHTDDTGWRVRGEAAFLMAFVNSSLSVYQVRRRHRNEEVRELIPADFAGVMICDRGKSYDADELESVLQQKCLAHLLRNAGEVARKKTGPARRSVCGCRNY